MPALKGAEIPRGYQVELSTLPAYLQRLIAADKAGPRCTGCGWAMPQASRDQGYFAHPVCGPLELPDPDAAAGRRPAMTARARGAAAAQRQNGEH